MIRYEVFLIMQVLQNCIFFRDNDLLPITNDDNYMAALKNAKPLLRLVIQREGE